MLEERLRAMEEHDAYEIDAFDMSLLSDVMIHPKFKTLDFKKYKWISCSKTHLTMYYGKMVVYSHNNKLFIQ